MVYLSLTSVSDRHDAVLFGYVYVLATLAFYQSPSSLFYGTFSISVVRVIDIISRYNVGRFCSKPFDIEIVFILGSVSFHQPSRCLSTAGLDILSLLCKKI